MGIALIRNFKRKTQEDSNCNLNFLPGKRDCLGKSLAISQYYLFLTGILQQFRLRSPLENLEDLSIEPKLGFTLSPQSFEVIAEPRL